MPYEFMGTRGFVPINKPSILIPRPRRVRRPIGPSCCININCGTRSHRYPQYLRGLSDDEQDYVLGETDYPDLMGRGRVRKFLKKHKKKLKKGAAALLTPLNPIAAAVALRRKRKRGGAALSKAQKRRRLKKGITAALVPGAGLAMAIRKRRQKRAAARRGSGKSPVVSRVVARGRVPSVVAAPVVQAASRGQTATAAVSQTMEPVAVTEQKKSGIGSILPIAALAALPFMLGS